MWENIEQDRHYTGIFNIGDEHISGELIYNKKNGVILLNVIKELEDEFCLGKSYGTFSVITGKLNSGAIVTLFNNRCTNNHTQAFQSQRLNFRAEYMIWANKENPDTKYNKIVCVLKNAYEWSGLSAFEESDSGLKVIENAEEKSYSWFGAKITFSTYLNNWLLIAPRDEETKIVQRLIVTIEMPEKHSPKEFASFRNKIISLISFAIKDNVNIEEEYLLDYDDSYTVARDFVDYHKHYLMTSEAQRDIFKSQIWNYNFTLEQIPAEKDINSELVRLEPVFNLYLSLFKYHDMPPEMVFLNIVQALETFHSRFFYNDKKEKYIKSVVERFGQYPNFEMYERLLLCDTQKDENCHYIILVSRLNDLLIGRENGLFLEYYWGDKNYAQTIADTRHYYTHYGKSKEAKALKGDELLEAIYILKVLLEYHICLVLGIDNKDKIGKELENHYHWKQLDAMQSQKTGR
ncbi:hypothetical protein D5282_25990 [bacterium 1xD8-48]|nr:hypothetical protein [bacterium 1xD8-48]